MASELLKNRALIQKLKEPEVPRVKFDLASTGFEELFTLPEPKPQELLDIQEDVRIQRQQDTMDKARPFLMDESVDFIEREEFNNGSKKFRKVTDEEFIKLYKEFQSLDNFGTDSEFVDFLNEKRIRPGTLGDTKAVKNNRFTIKTASGRRRRLNLKTEVKQNISPKRQAETAKINELVQKEVNIANKGSKYVSPSKIFFKIEDQLGIKPYYIDRINPDTGKKTKVRSVAMQPKSYPAIKNLDSMITKVDNVLKDMLISEEPLNNYFYKELSERTGLSNKSLQSIRNDVPTYKVIADQGADKLLEVTNAPYLKKLNLSQQLVEGLEIQKGLPRFINTEEGVKYITRPRANVMQFARRSWNNNKGQGEIKFFDKNGKLIKWERGLELPYKNVSFSYGGKKYNVSNLSPSLIQKDFPEVKKVTEAANKLRTTEIDNPFKPGKKITVNNLIRKIQIDGYKWNPKLGTINILHGPEGVANKPFTDLTYNTRDINQLEAGFTSSLKAGNITETQYKRVIKELYKPFVKGDLDKAIIDRITKQAQQMEKGKFYGFEDLATKVGQKKLTALQQLASGKNVGFDPILATRAGFEEFVKPAAKIGLRGAAGLADLALSAGAGPIGLGVGALIETGQAMPELTRGNIKEAGRRTIIGSLLPESLVGSMRGDLLKLAETPEEKIAMQNFIDFEKDREKYESRVKNLRYLEENPFEAEGIDLSILQNKVLEQRADLEQRAPEVFFKEFAQEILPNLVRRLDAQNVKNLEGILGSIVGRRGIDDREDIIQDIGKQVVTKEEPFYGQAPVQVSPEELDEIYESGIMAMANGGRIGFADGPDDPSKRTFMKIMAGIASLPVLGKFFKSANVAKKVVPLTNTTTTMPEWFPQFVEKALATGVQKKIDADLIEVKIPELPDVKMEVRTDGKVYVEGKNAYNEPYQIEYEPPGYEVLDYETGKAVKTKGDFQATDTEYRMVGEDDYDVDGVVLDNVDEVLGGSATKLEGFAKGTGKEKYTIGQKRIDEAEMAGERADENIPYKDMDPTDFADE